MDHTLTNMSIACVPDEILRRILRHVTSVIGAFETEVVICQQEDREAVSQSIRESMSTRTSLSLVSKHFHDLSDEYLFEVIVIRTPEHIRPLVELLRRENEDRPKRGWWCRRLEIDLNYRGFSWTWGKFTLWGLVPACPRLLDLRCCIKFKEHHPMFQFHGSTNPTLRYPISETLLQLISSMYNTTLHRLEFAGQVTISFDFAEKLLSHLKCLRSCRLLGLLPRGHPDYRDDIQKEYEEAVVLQDPVEAEEYETAREQAHWPECRPTSPSDNVLELPHLHTLDISHFVPSICTWSIPSLTVVGAGVFHLVGPPDVCAAILKIGIGATAASITKLTSYANSGAGVDIWLVSKDLPNLEILEYHLSEKRLRTIPSEPLRKLRSLTIYRHYMQATGHNELLTKIYDSIRAGLFPTLERVRVTGMFVSPALMEPILTAEFGAVGVKLEFGEEADVPVRVYQ